MKNNQYILSEQSDEGMTIVMGKKTESDNRINVRYPFKADLVKDAKRHNLTVSQYVNWILQNRAKLGIPPR